ncbi:MAG: cytochrome-c oxidase, cbb3-type subunit I [Deltaproteobacteria bacterium]|nr:cytochrome-c oxidase, cbb3-type subunit I [Deltaproteobacteria bacterium]
MSTATAPESLVTRETSDEPRAPGGETLTFEDRWIRYFVWASVLWGVVGMLVGALVALQLAWWPANVGPWLTFGRLRPLHTNAVIFAFVGNMMFAGVYHSSTRLLRAKLHEGLTAFHFWGWQLIIVSAALTLPLGLTQGKEYAELIWPIDLAVAVVWLTFGANFFLLLKNRREKHLYVAIWFYIATVVTITVLYVLNNLALPFAATGSYGVFAGVQDGLVQWWYGHNAVAFFLTTPILGIMYYYVPKAADRPVYSYRLSIVHFWSLIFLYIWAGPHHLLNTALPDWAQSLGMLFSLMLWAPSWGGMVNGLLTLRGAWDKLRTDPVLKFFAAGVTFYGMATFEGPLLSIRAVNELAHYTDWIIGHVHGGALGWNGFMAAGMFYWLVPQLYGTKLYSRRAADWHFYVGTLGIVIYMAAMYISGITQGLMWRAENEGGGLLYPTFVETVTAILPMYWVRLVGGSMYLVGFVVMAWNLVMTARSGAPVHVTVKVPSPLPAAPVPWGKVLGSAPVLLVILVSTVLGASAVLNEMAGASLVIAALVIAVLGGVYVQVRRVTQAVHHELEGTGILFTVLVTVSILVGGIAELLPTVAMGVAERETTRQTPYTPLELEGRDVYVAEGCYTCHSQMIRPFTWESARYGAVSETADSIWDRPYQWGSKRTGPDLAREGGRYPSLWHYQHMVDPRSTSPGSIMPSYAHLATTPVDYERTPNKLRTLQSLGVPYDAEDIDLAASDAREQAAVIVEDLRVSGDVEDADPSSELVAMIAYLQRLGRVESSFVPERDREEPTAVSEAAAGAAAGGGGGR